MSSILNYPLDRPVVVEASAGTGKTYTLSYLCLRVVLERNLPLQQLLILTFTDAATQELQARVRQLIKQAIQGAQGKSVSDQNLAHIIARAQAKWGNEEVLARLNEALQNMDEVQISTIHSFCQSALSRYAFQSGQMFGAELLSDQFALIQSAVHDFWRSEIYPASKNTVAHLLDRAKITPGKWVQLLEKHLGNPFLGLAPDCPEETPDQQFMLESWQREFLQLKQLWFDTPEIPTWVKEAKVRMNKAHPGMMQSYFENEKASMNLPVKAFEAFTRPNHPHPFFALAASYLEHFKFLDKDFDDKVVRLYYKLFEEVASQLTRLKWSRNQMSFDDLLNYLHQALHDPYTGPSLAQSLRANYPIAFVDEFQDTDRVQYEIFARIYELDHAHKADAMVYLIGDPKQSIYGFRGADLYTYRTATAQAQRIVLEANWRSHPQLLEAVEYLFQLRERPFQLDDDRLPAIDFQHVKAGQKSAENPLIDPLNLPVMPFWAIERIDGGVGIKRNFIAQAVAHEISRLLQGSLEGQISHLGQALEARDIAVIVRKGSHIKLIAEALEKLNIPTVAYLNDNLMASADAEELQQLLMALEQPRKEHFVRMALATDYLGLTGTDLLDLIDDEMAWERRLEDFRSYHQMWRDKGFIAMMTHFIENENVEQHLARYPDAERKITNLRQLTQVLYEQSQRINMGTHALVSWLGQQRMKALSEDEEIEHSLELYTDRNAVKVMTIHRSKGLEFPVVFCPFLWDHAHNSSTPIDYYDPEARQKKLFLSAHEAYETERESAKAWRKLQSQSEEIRLMYVALTRAKSRCYVVWQWKNKGKSKTLCEWSPLGYLLGMTDTAFNEAQEDEAITEILAPSPLGLQPNAPPVNGEKLSLPPVQTGSYELAKKTDFSSWHTSSFTSLTAYAQTYRNPLVFDQDRHNENEPELEAAAPNQDPESPSIHELRGGSQIGQFFHSLFENLRFDADYATILKRVEKTAPRLQVTEHFFEAIAQSVFKSLNSPLPCVAPDFTLSKLGPKQRMVEMAFQFPLSKIQPWGLKKIFDEHSHLPIGELYFKDVEGLLKGFIDLVFEYEGKYYLLDYKSNRLGDTADAYDAQAIDNAMRDGHYALQYHLYTVALHKYLQLRLRDYSYASHFGGVLYLFIRGIEPDKAEQGIFFDRPSLTMIQHLESYLGAPV